MGKGKPWSQEELIITKNVIKKLQRLDEVAVILIGRTAGEDKDNSITEGSYLLTKTEEELIKKRKNYL